MWFFKKISSFEWRDLLTAWFCLSVAFTLGISSGGLAQIFNIGKTSVCVLVITFIAAGTTIGLSFVLHELAHKFVAIHYGYWAEFRKNIQMLLIAVVAAVVTGIVFAAPGATLINTAGHKMTEKEAGIISLAGPLANIALTLPFSVCMVIGLLCGGTLNDIFTIPGFLFYSGMIGFQVNAMFAFFNTLPVNPLDGRKILRWNTKVFITLIGISLLALSISLQPQTIVSLLT